MVKDVAVNFFHSARFGMPVIMYQATSALIAANDTEEAMINVDVSICVDSTISSPSLANVIFV